MKATKTNTTGNCQRCGQWKPYILASGFNQDGSFRMLCTTCDSVERWRNQLHLFAVPVARPKPIETPAEEEPVPVSRNDNQLSLGL